MKRVILKIRIWLARLVAPESVGLVKESHYQMLGAGLRNLEWYTQSSGWLTENPGRYKAKREIRKVAPALRALHEEAWI